MNNKTPNAYRAIFKKDEKAYKNDPSVLPNLTGSYFNSYEGYKNNCTYLDDVQYLHFFKTENEAITYAASLRKELGKAVSVGRFYFDEELLKTCTFKGMYLINSDTMRYTERDEYIIPLNLYNANENFIEFVPRHIIDEQTKPEPYDPDGYMNNYFF